MRTPIAPSAPISANGSDMSTASGSVSEPNNIIISMYISSTAMPMARARSPKALPPCWP